MNACRLCHTLTTGAWCPECRTQIARQRRLNAYRTGLDAAPVWQEPSRLQRIRPAPLPPQDSAHD